MPRALTFDSAAKSSLALSPESYHSEPYHGKPYHNEPYHNDSPASLASPGLSSPELDSSGAARAAPRAGMHGHMHAFRALPPPLALGEGSIPDSPALRVDRAYAREGEALHGAVAESPCFALARRDAAPAMGSGAGAVSGGAGAAIRGVRPKMVTLIRGAQYASPPLASMVALAETTAEEVAPASMLSRASVPAPIAAVAAAGAETAAETAAEIAIDAETAAGAETVDAETVADTAADSTSGVSAVIARAVDASDAAVGVCAAAVGVPDAAVGVCDAAVGVRDAGSAVGSAGSPQSPAASGTGLERAVFGRAGTTSIAMLTPLPRVPAGASWDDGLVGLETAAKAACPSPPGGSSGLYSHLVGFLNCSGRSSARGPNHPNNAASVSGEFDLVRALCPTLGLPHLGPVLPWACLTLGSAPPWACLTLGLSYLGLAHPWVLY